MFDLRRLEGFVAFADALSFTRAAKALHVSQPALYMQVTKLADEIGVALYARRGAQLALTPEGERVAAFGRELLAAATKLEGELRGEPAKAPLVLCAGEGAYLYLLGPALRAFSLERAGALRLLTRDRDGTLQAVRSGEAQVGVIAVDATRANAGQTGPLTATMLTEVGQVLALPRRHPLARKRHVSLGDLAGVRLVVPEDGRPHRAMLEAALEGAGIQLDVAVEANGWELMLHFVALGVGLAIVNACCRMPPGIVARPIEGFTRQRYVVLTPARAASDPRVARLSAVLHAHADAWKTS